MLTRELSKGAGSTWVAAVSEGWKHNDCRLLLEPLSTQRDAHGCYCKDVTVVHGGGKGMKKECQRYDSMTEAHHATLLECDPQGCRGHCTYRPFARLGCTANLFCALMLKREKCGEIPARASCFHSQEQSNFFFKNQISHQFCFSDNHLNIYTDLISCLTCISP